MGCLPILGRESEGFFAEGAFRWIEAGQFDGDGACGLSIEDDIKGCGVLLFCGDEMAVITCCAGLLEGDAWRSRSDG